MSEENLEIVRAIFDAWAIGDFGSGAPNFDPNVVMVIRDDFPEFGVFLGLQGVTEYLERMLEQWERLTVEASELRAFGDTVVARVLQRGKGRVSGIEVDDRYLTLFTLRGRKVVRFEAVRTEEEAFAAVGLSE